MSGSSSLWEDADWGRRVRERAWGWVYYVPSARGTRRGFGISRAGHRLASVVDFHT